MPVFYYDDVRQFALGGKTLGELLANLERRTGAWVVPHTPPKYFHYHASRHSPDYVLVDIHVVREGVEICPKQDLSFQLFPTDKVKASVDARFC